VASTGPRATGRCGHSVGGWRAGGCHWRWSPAAAAARGRGGFAARASGFRARSGLSVGDRRRGQPAICSHDRGVVAIASRGRRRRCGSGGGSGGSIWPHRGPRLRTIARPAAPAIVRGRCALQGLETPCRDLLRRATRQRRRRPGVEGPWWPPRRQSTGCGATVCAESEACRGPLAVEEALQPQRQPQRRPGGAFSTRAPVRAGRGRAWTVGPRGGSARPAVAGGREGRPRTSATTARTDAELRRGEAPQGPPRAPEHVLAGR